MLKERTAITLILTVLAATGIGLVRGVQDPMENLDSFQAMRVNWGPDFDMVLAGDSRINQGVDPATLQKHLGDITIANFGWGHVALNAEYLNAVDDLLNPESPQPAVVIGISPLSLTTLGVEENEWTVYRDKHPASTWQQETLGTFLSLYRPVALQSRRTLRVESRLDRVKVFHDNGWASTTMQPEKPEIALGFQQNHFSRYQVSEEIVRQLIAAIRSWEKEGVEVFGFLMPASEKMIALEARISGINLDNLIERFRDAGAEWLSFNSGAFHSYDGQHLRSDAAVHFSNVLGRRLANRLERKEE